jgi:hypothetical protein
LAVILQSGHESFLGHAGDCRLRIEEEVSPA